MDVVIRTQSPDIPIVVDLDTDGAFTSSTPAACCMVHGDLKGVCDYSKFGLPLY